MKFPKHRSTVYTVVRRFDDDYCSNFHTVGVFGDPNEADDYAGKCTQEWLEKYKDTHGVFFEVQITTFYG